MSGSTNIMRERAAWGVGGIAAGAALMAAVWAGVGARTAPEESARGREIILPSYGEPVERPAYAQPLVAPVPVGSAPLSTAAPERGLDEPAAAEPEPARVEPPPVPAAPIEPGPGPTPGLHLIDVNRASAAELDLLPGIGPALAARIIAERERGGRFTSLRDLQRVSGIGPRTAEKLEGLVRFE